MPKCGCLMGHRGGRREGRSPCRDEIRVRFLHPTSHCLPKGQPSATCLPPESTAGPRGIAPRNYAIAPVVNGANGAHAAPGALLRAAASGRDCLLNPISEVTDVAFFPSLVVLACP